ncbi:uncharacterized protein PV09_01790 [Verruconis gallopava]|uniref:Phosphoribosylaminoimidazole-succinocarboxamide synthase n=1 Tax=Verruconis gallopava TaxID=253628 RepID=A0A0D1Z4I4_9PEZI|nr:uncharacterized protein PV09_01790 [Verruconis gallopava]KIW07877.1 hypothetical protein PV09_01790 [Verruconis gallopava]
MSLTSETSRIELRDSSEYKPRLLHSHSRQSIAASEDYYSVHSASERGDETQLLPPSSADRRRFSTPPSRRSTPDDESVQPSGNPGSSTRRSIGLDDLRHTRRKAVGSGGPKELVPGGEPKSLVGEKSLQQNDRREKMDLINRTYTPGQDDSQFIRFAIDQLTRDEEVRGSRTYPVREDEQHSSSTSAEDLEHAMHPYQDYPAIVPAVVAAAASGHDETRGRVPTPMGIRLVSTEEERELRVPPPPQRIEDDIVAIPQTPEPIRRERALLAEQKEMQAGPAPQHPLTGAPSASSSSLHGVSESDVFVAYNPLRPTTQQPRLNFVPGILRPLWLGMFILVCLLMLTGLLFCAVWCLTHDGLWDYRFFGDGRYFVFEYLPTLFGMIILVWLLQVEIALIRIAPFMAMTLTSTKARSEAQFLSLYPTQFLLPKIEYFRSGQPILGTCFIIFWLFLFTIPLLGSSFNVRFFGPRSDGVWRWVAVQGVIWTVIVLYILLIVALLVLLIHLRRSETGLKWDPRSLADLIALLERANFVNEYTGTEIYTHLNDFRQRLWNCTPRLGYWHTSHRPTDIFYGLGEEGGLTRRYSIESGRIREKGHKYHPSIDSHEDAEAGDHSRVQLNYRHGVVRRRFIPWFLSSTAVLAWILIAFVLLIAFYVVAFVNNATTGHGFIPQIRADTNSAGFSPANFLYSFVPCLIGFLLYLLWLPLDYALRRLEPYRHMTSVSGALAEHTLLLDYPFRLPISTTLTAASNGHWKIAFVSSMSLVNTAIPVLSGGIFWAQWYTGDTEVRISAQASGMYALCVFLALYAVGLVLLAPGRTFIRMPHESKCLAEVVSWLYQSPILLDRAFTRCQSKVELQTRLLGERPALPAPGLWASVTNLMHSMSRDTLRRGGDAALERPENRKAKAVLGADRAPPLPPADTTFTGPSPGEKRTSAYSSAERALYAFGVYTGRDGRDHLGIDKVGRGMVLFDD